MTPQEAQMLQDLVRKVEGTALTEKDPDAEALLMDGLARDPDAIYKLAQTVLIQNIALEQAHAQMQAMQQQLTPAQPQPARATSFLGGLLHRNAPPAQYQGPPPQYRAPPQGYPAASWGPPSYPPPGPGYGAPGYGAPGGFLRSAATTAAGVAGGMLAFEGVEHLLHGGFGGGFGGFGGYGGAPMEETVVNNYYDNAQGQIPGQGMGEPDPGQQPTDERLSDYGADTVPGSDPGQDVYDASADDPQQGGYGDGSAGQQADDQGFADDSGGNFSGGGDDSNYA